MTKTKGLFSALLAAQMAMASLWLTLAVPATYATTVLPAFDSQIDAIQAPTGFGVWNVWKVWPNEQYKRPSDVVGLVHDGDIVEIDAATYKCDTSVKWSKNFLTIRGVGGRPVLDATGCSISGGKGIWNPTYAVNNMIVDNIEFAGAKVSDRNGAGIRYDGNGYLYITNSNFHDNENGVLITPYSSADVVIDHSEFARNGAGDGYSHNMYISGNTNSFVLRYSYSHEANIGHTVKSRAKTNYIVYNRLSDETEGKSSYNIDIPQGGLTYIIGNVIQQGPKSPNYGIISYSAESNSNPIQKVYIANNTIVSEGLPAAIAVNLYDKGLAEAKMVNNLIVGVNPGNLVGVTPAKMTMVNNVVTSTPNFLDATNRNYKITASSPAVNAAVDAGAGGSVSLNPAYQYSFPTSYKTRTPVGQASDVGAYEYDPNEAVIPAPTVSLSLAKPDIDNNTSAILQWSSTNATKCQAYGAWAGSQPTSGTYVSEPLLANKTFSITCTGDGGFASVQVVENVNDAPEAMAMGTYTWTRASGSKINNVCAANLKDANGNPIYKDNFGTGPYCESKGGAATGIYVPGTGRWYLMGGGGGRNYYGNEVYAFNFNTMKSEMVLRPTHISDSAEYTPSDLYGSKIHMQGCNGILHLKDGSIAPAPRAIHGGAAYNPLTRKIVVGPTGFVRGATNCDGSALGRVATDMWSYDPFANQWALLAPENEKFGSVTEATWFLDPKTGIAFDAGNRNGKTRGGYLIDHNSTLPQPPSVLVDNVWPFGGIENASNVIDTTNNYAFSIANTGVSAFNLNGLSMTKYGTNGSVGTTGTAGDPGPLFEADTSWKYAGDTTLLELSDFAVTYNPKLAKFVAWGGDDRIFFLTPDYRAKTLTILTKHVTGNPSGTVGYKNKFTYIPEKDMYLAFVGTDQDFYFLNPPKDATTTSATTTTATKTSVNSSAILQRAITVAYVKEDEDEKLFRLIA